MPKANDLRLQSENNVLLPTTEPTSNNLVVQECTTLEPTTTTTKAENFIFKSPCLDHLLTRSNVEKILEETDAYNESMQEAFTDLLTYGLGDFLNSRIMDIQADGIHLATVFKEQITHEYLNVEQPTASTFRDLTLDDKVLINDMTNITRRLTCYNLPTVLQGVKSLMNSPGGACYYHAFEPYTRLSQMEYLLSGLKAMHYLLTTNQTNKYYPGQLFLTLLNNLAMQSAAQTPSCNK